MKPADSLTRQLLVTYGCMALWIFLSAVVILLNKQILSFSDFPYPISLTLTHMIFCSFFAWVLIKFKVTPSVEMDMKTYLTGVLPIAALFSATLWLGNAAYMFLSVHFIQMIKAVMPVTVFIVGTMLGTEKFSYTIATNMIVVALGVAISSYGELHFNLVGVLFQGGSIISESFRLALIQVLLQQRGIKLNPITTLYYIAPACAACLLVPFSFIELPQIYREPEFSPPYAWLFASTVGAFALNMSVFLLIGKSSALTMNIAGVIKDWMLIGLSVVIFKSEIALLQLCGYGVAFMGVAWYNYQKIQGMKAAAKDTQPDKPASPPVAKVPEKEPFLNSRP